MEFLLTIFLYLQHPYMDRVDDISVSHLTVQGTQEKCLALGKMLSAQQVEMVSQKRRTMSRDRYQWKAEYTCKPMPGKQARTQLD